MELEQKVGEVLRRLDENYGTVSCHLNYDDAYQLLIATILSAQCTDDRVNIITKDLFKKYRTLRDFAQADLIEMEKDIRTAGFYHNKAKHIINSSQKLLYDYNGKVPEDINELIKLPGVGRKTANVIRGHIYNIPSIVVDTHVRRVSNLIGFTDSQDPVKIEFRLMEILPEDHWINYNTQIISHGRKICIARRPKCNECFLYDCCDGRK